MESPFAENEIYVLMSRAFTDRGLSLWSVSMNQTLDAKEVDLITSHEGTAEKVFLIPGDDADVFVGVNAANGSATLSKFYLTDAERQPLVMNIDPLGCFQSIQITSLDTVDNTNMCVIALFKGQTEEEYTSFAQLWDGNSGVALVRCLHPLGPSGGQISSNDPVALLTKQHLDGVLFYFFANEIRSSKDLTPRVMAQNPTNGVSVPVSSFQDPELDAERTCASWFSNDCVIGAVYNKSVLCLWNIKKGLITAKIALENGLDSIWTNASMDNDNNLVVTETLNESCYVNFWSYSPV